jgi:hypothetical protein
MLLLIGDRRDEKAISIALIESAQSKPVDLPDLIASETRSEIKNEPSRLINHTEAVSS